MKRLLAGWLVLVALGYAGDRVHATRSQPPDLVRVPDVAGAAPQAAVDAVSRADLCFTHFEPATAAGTIAVVAATPGSGSHVPRFTKVALAVPANASPAALEVTVRTPGNECLRDAGLGALDD